MTKQHNAPEGGLTVAVAAAILWGADPQNAGLAWIEALDAAASPMLRRRANVCQLQASALLAQLAPTPPTPSGLVDAEVPAGLRLLGTVWRSGVFWHRSAMDDWPPEGAQIFTTLDATLSGQQGGAVPAGDLRPGLREAIDCLAEELKRSSNNKERGALMGLLGVLYARLAEQPTPAGTGDADRVEKNSPPLTCDFENAFPDGSRDLSSYSDVESALDRAGAPSCGRDGRWLTLPQRIAALDGASGQGEGL